jgi:hypothetical protein
MLVANGCKYVDDRGLHLQGLLALSRLLARLLALPCLLTRLKGSLSAC